MPLGVGSTKIILPEQDFFCQALVPWPSGLMHCAPTACNVSLLQKCHRQVIKLPVTLGLSVGSLWQS